MGENERTNVEDFINSSVIFFIYMIFYYLKINVESRRISCSYHHEAFNFGICESWSHYDENKSKNCID